MSNPISNVQPNFCRRRAIWSEPVVTNTEIKHEEVKENQTALQEVSQYACPKCGKEVRRGMYFHQKYCKG